MQSIILHIYFYSFFASVEQQDNPLFRGRPLGVTAHNGRSAIIAASREAKRMGVKSPTRVYEARKICPNLVLCTSHFTRYWEISKIFIKICTDYSPNIEVFSLDELFMDVTHTAVLFGGVDSLILTIKKRIKNEIGEYITVSVGVSHNRLLAKLASGWKKPDGVFKINPENLFDVYAKAKLTDICGIGSRIERRLNAMGIYNLLQLRNVSLLYLIAEFGNVQGHALKNISLGVDMSPVRPFTTSPDVRSVGRNYCLPQNEYDKRRVLQNFCELWEEIAIKLRRLKKKSRTIGFYLSGTEAIHGRKTYSNYFNSGKEMFEAALSLIKKEEFVKGYTRQIGVWTSSLVDEALVPQSLFDQKMQDPKLINTIDALNKKYGDHTVRNGYLLYADKLTTVPNGFMADRYERTLLSEYKIEPRDPYSYGQYLDSI